MARRFLGIGYRKTSPDLPLGSGQVGDDLAVFAYLVITECAELRVDREGQVRSVWPRLDRREAQLLRTRSVQVSRGDRGLVPEQLAVESAVGRHEHARQENRAVGLRPGRALLCQPGGDHCSGARTRTVLRHGPVGTAPGSCRCRAGQTRGRWFSVGDVHDPVDGHQPTPALPRTPRPRAAHRHREPLEQHLQRPGAQPLPGLCQRSCRCHPPLPLP